MEGCGLPRLSESCPDGVRRSGGETEQRSSVPTCRGGGPEPADRSWRIIDPDGLDIAPCRQVHQTPCDDKAYFTSHLLPCIYHIL